MRVLAIELRRSRMWPWVAAAAVLWVTLMLTQSDQWAGSWTQTRLWMAVPSAYLGPFIAAGAADVSRLRVASGQWSHAAVAARLPLAPWFVHVAATLVVAWTAPAAALVVGFAVTATRTGVGQPVSGYFWAGALFTSVMVLLGYALGAALRSLVAAPLIAFVVGLVLALYGQPVPATARPWLVMAPSELALQGGLLVLLLGLALVASRSHLVTRHRDGTTSAGRQVAVVAVVLLAFTAAAAPQRSAQVLREPPADVACASTDGGTDVCLWPEDADAYLEPMTAQAERAEELRDALGVEQRDLHQPGLDAAASGDVVIIEPLGAGAGLWFPAQSVAFDVYNALPKCDPGEFDEAERSARRVRSWAMIDVMTGYVFGGVQPGQVVDASSDEELRAAAEVTAQVSGLPATQQLAWLGEETDRMTVDCG